MYVFDTNTLTAIFRHYYYKRFPSFWEKFNVLKEKKTIISVREVRNEIESLKRGDTLDDWIKNNTDFFANPAVDELKFITSIYQISYERKTWLDLSNFFEKFTFACLKAILGDLVFLRVLSFFLSFRMLRFVSS